MFNNIIYLFVFTMQLIIFRTFFFLAFSFSNKKHTKKNTITLFYQCCCLYEYKIRLKIEIFIFIRRGIVVGICVCVCSVCICVFNIFIIFCVKHRQIQNQNNIINRHIGSILSDQTAHAFNLSILLTIPEKKINFRLIYIRYFFFLIEKVFLTRFYKPYKRKIKKKEKKTSMNEILLVEDGIIIIQHWCAKNINLLNKSLKFPPNGLLIGQQ